jgi:hypothetical protein
VERFFSNALGRPASTQETGASPITASSLAMDFRTDEIAAWVQGGSLYAQDMPAKQPPHRARRLGPAAPASQLSTLLSDDNRGMVAWATTSGTTESVYFDYSRVGVRFEAPQLLERFTIPDQAQGGSPQLIRLSSESVMIAWQGAQEGRWAVRTAAVDARGIGSPSTIAVPGADVLLDQLVAGPQGEAIALMTEAPPAGGERALLSARGVDAYPDHTYFAAPETIAPAGALGTSALAIDPATGRAVAVWQAAGDVLEYALRRSG